MDGKKILVVSDEWTCGLFSKLFENDDIEVVTSDPENVLELLKDNSFPIIFLDIDLRPKNSEIKNMFKLLNIIKINHEDTLFFAVTKNLCIYAHAKCINSGFQNYFRISKPSNSKFKEFIKLFSQKQYQKIVKLKNKCPLFSQVYSIKRVVLEKFSNFSHFSAIL